MRHHKIALALTVSGVFWAVLLHATLAVAVPVTAQWIWNPSISPDAENEFVYFRKTFLLDRVDPRAAIYFAADSQAQISINGYTVAHKVTRFTVDHVRPQRLLIGPWLRTGVNEVLVLHHNWGAIKTFQRESRRRAGLWIEPVAGASLAVLATNSSWQTAEAPQFSHHSEQTVGNPDRVGGQGDTRVRFPVIEDGSLTPRSQRQFDALPWRAADPIAQPIWTIEKQRVATPQREYFFPIQRVLAAGRVQSATPLARPVAEARQVLDAADQIDRARFVPDPLLTEQVRDLAQGRAVSLSGHDGETQYLAFDFHQPVHGYPRLQLQTTQPGIAVTLLYGELNLSHSDRTLAVDPDTGKLFSSAVVGKPYFDRYLTAGLGTAETVEMPDERTARYLLVVVTFPPDLSAMSTLTLAEVGLVKSQFPVDWIGSFDGGNPRLDQIMALSKIHAETTMSDAYVDTPGREDGAWLEDIAARARLADTWIDNSAELRRRVLLDAEESRTSEGRFLAFAPQSFIESTAWDWGMRWVWMLQDDWRWSGDRVFLAGRFPTLVAYIDLLLGQVDSTGLFRTANLFGDIRIGSHPKSDRDVSSIGQADLIKTLQVAIELANASGAKAASARWASARAALLAGYRRALLAKDDMGAVYAADVLDGETGRTEGKSQAAQIAAMDAEVLTDAEADEIIGRFFVGEAGAAPAGVAAWNNPTYGERLLTQLVHHGFGHKALQHLLFRYGNYLPFAPTNESDIRVQGPLGGPLPEYFITAQEGSTPTGVRQATQPVDPTGSHGWAAVPLVWLHRSVLGVSWDFDSNGRSGAHVRIEPQDCGLPYLNGNVQTPRGAVRVSWDPQRRRLQVDIPNAVKATVIPPVRAPWQLTAHPVGARSRQLPGGFELSGGGRYVISLEN